MSITIAVGGDHVISWMSFKDCRSHLYHSQLDTGSTGQYGSFEQLPKSSIKVLRTSLSQHVSLTRFQSICEQRDGRVVLSCCSCLYEINCKGRNPHAYYHIHR